MITEPMSAFISILFGVGVGLVVVGAAWFAYVQSRYYEPSRNQRNDER